MDQNGSFPDIDGADDGAEPVGVQAGNPAGDKAGGQTDEPAGPSRSTYAAEPADFSRAGVEPRDGFTGSLVLQGVEALDGETTGMVLSRLDQLMRWAQAQQAKVLHRMENIFRDEFVSASGRVDPGLAFSLAASEAAAILSVPHTTGQRLMGEAGILCRTHPATLAGLEQGRISYAHAQTVLDQTQNLDQSENQDQPQNLDQAQQITAADLQAFEAKLLEAAAGQTPSQFRVRARRLRERQYPQSIVKRQLTAFEKRRVCLEPEADGMSWLSAFLPAEKAQALFTQLSKAARGEQSAGDPRTVDQLRADILEDLLLSSGQPVPEASAGTEATARAKARAEILVLISAETLFGADDEPAELHGYGPISPQTARHMAREAAKWTPVERDPETEEILRVGRRRKVPAGLQRWLRARDGTCRFPGCRSNAVISEIDHTKPWAQGGTTDHDNLEHLCRRHHMFKTEGFWKACQPSAGIIEWTSPGGRRYRTEPHLSYGGSSASSGTGFGPGGSDRGFAPDQIRKLAEGVGKGPDDPDDYGDDPPPF